tara:strand:- start:4287 stop:4901 length:615 start_codon:yes stop_codon:yes gene_type:complete
MIPKNWKEVTIELFTKLYPTFKTEEMTDTEIVDNKIKQLSYIKGISLEEAEMCTISEGNKVKELLALPIPTKIVKLFKLNGITYRFNVSSNDLNAGGYIGVMNAIKEDPIKNMHVTMFNLATPVKYSWWRAKWVGYDFNPSEVGDRLEEFKQLPISIAYPIAVFFLTLSKVLTPVTQDYLSQSLEIMKKSLKETKEDLKSSDGL